MVICDSLEKKGLLNRVKDPADRRINRIVLTEDSKTIIAEACQIITTRYKTMTDSISQETLEKILLELEKLYEIIQQHSKKDGTKQIVYSQSTPKNE